MTYSVSPLATIAEALIPVNSNAHNAGQITDGQRLLRTYISLDKVKEMIQGRPEDKRKLTKEEFESLSNPFTGCVSLRSDISHSLLWPFQNEGSQFTNPPIAVQGKIPFTPPYSAIKSCQFVIFTHDEWTPANVEYQRLDVLSRSSVEGVYILPKTVCQVSQVQLAHHLLRVGKAHIYGFSGLAGSSGSSGHTCAYCRNIIEHYRSQLTSVMGALCSMRWEQVDALQTTAGTAHKASPEIFAFLVGHDLADPNAVPEGHSGAMVLDLRNLT